MGGNKDGGLLRGPVRFADPSDLPRLLDMGRAFHEAAKPEHPWSADDFATLVRSLMDSGYVAISDGGFMVGVISAHPLNRSWLIAHELLWWATDNSGAGHLRAFRKWAKANGASEIRWSCRSENDRVRRFYSKFSRPVEAVYSEAL